jgi:hypothetical protein
MGIVASAESGGATKYLHPAGQYVAVCVDVIDLGYVDVNWQGNIKKQHKVVVRFWCGEYNDEKEPLFAGERFTLSLHEQSALRPFLEAWRGKAFTAEELKGFDLEKLIGVNALLQISHATKNERTFANITSIMMPPKGSETIRPLADYVRAKDRKEEQQQTQQPAGLGGKYDDSDDLPF